MITNQYLIFKNTDHTFFNVSNCIVFMRVLNLSQSRTKVRPLFSLPHRGSDISPLLMVFSANDIDLQSNRDFYATEGTLEALTF